MGAMWKQPFLGSARLISLVCLACLGPVSEAAADLCGWADTRGVVHIVDQSVAIPEAYRGQVAVHRSSSSVTKVASSPLLIVPSNNPSDNYSIRGQGSFAQKIAADFGLIKNGSTDALRPLSGIGIQPAGGRKVAHALDPDTVDRLAVAARRAATAQRLTLSADGAEAMIRPVAGDFILPAPLSNLPRQQSRKSSLSNSHHRLSKSSTNSITLKRLSYSMPRATVADIAARDIFPLWAGRPAAHRIRFSGPTPRFGRRVRQLRVGRLDAQSVEGSLLQAPQPRPWPHLVVANHSEAVHKERDKARNSRNRE